MSKPLIEKSCYMLADRAGDGITRTVSKPETGTLYLNINDITMLFR
jgi:hypothetical protein